MARNSQKLIPVLENALAIENGEISNHSPRLVASVLVPWLLRIQRDGKPEQLEKASELIYDYYSRIES